MKFFLVLLLSSLSSWFQVFVSVFISGFKHCILLTPNSLIEIMKLISPIIVRTCRNCQKNHKWLTSAPNEFHTFFVNWWYKCNLSACKNLIFLLENLKIFYFLKEYRHFVTILQEIIFISLNEQITDFAIEIYSKS